MLKLLALSCALVAVPAIAFADGDAPLPSSAAAIPTVHAGQAIVAQAAPSPSTPAASDTLTSPAPESTPTFVPTTAPTATPEPARRPGFDQPMDSVFPNGDFGGPLIGTNIDPTGFPLEKALAAQPGFGQWLDSQRIRVYGWLNPGIELTSTSKLNTYPISYNPVANRLELDQATVRLERDPDTVQQDHSDWGFRISNIYGVDYRWTSAYGYQSGQLQTKNLLNGYDDPELFAMLYEPRFFKGGTVIELGRVISVPDIEAQLAPQNYLYTHSIMFDWDSYTQTGLIFWSKLSNMFLIDYGVTWGDDVQPFSPTQRFPTGQFFVKYTTKANKDDILIGADAYNNKGFTYYVAGASPQTAAQCAAYQNTVVYANNNTGAIMQGISPGTCLYGHDNLQQFNLTWYHTFSTVFHNAFEAYYLWTRNAPEGGSISNGPLQYAAGGGPGAFIPGRATAVGFVDYLEYKFSSRDFVSFRTDYMNDPQGWRTGYRTSYGSLTLGVTHHFSPLTWIRPEVRIEKDFAKGVNVYDNLEAASGYVGTKNYQSTLGIDLIQWF